MHYFDDPNLQGLCEGLTSQEDKTHDDVMFMRSLLADALEEQGCNLAATRLRAKSWVSSKHPDGLQLLVDGEVIGTLVLPNRARLWRGYDVCGKEVARGKW